MGFLFLSPALSGRALRETGGPPALPVLLLFVVRLTRYFVGGTWVNSLTSPRWSALRKNGGKGSRHQPRSPWEARRGLDKEVSALGGGGRGDGAGRRSLSRFS